MIYLLAVLAGAIILIALFAVLYWLSTRVVCEEIAVHSEGVTSELCILHLSDLHFRRLGRLEKNVLKLRRRLDPDLILFSGDWLRLAADMSGLDRFLRLMDINCPAFTVLGNHDGRLNLWDFEELRTVLTNNGITLLRDERMTLRIRSDHINIRGYELRGREYDPPEELLTADAVDGLEVVLAHTYDIVDYLHNGSWDLVLVGDTHGGQIMLPLLGTLPLKLRGTDRFVAGSYELADFHLYVNRGLGTTYIPFRIGSSPELACFRVIPARTEKVHRS